MTDSEKLDAIINRLDRLELIESHLLEILLPQRRDFLRQPHIAPPAVVSDDVKKLCADFSSLHGKVDGLHAKLDALAPEEDGAPDPEAHG